MKSPAISAHKPQSGSDVQVRLLYQELLDRWNERDAKICYAIY